MRNLHNGDHEIIFQLPDPTCKRMVEKSCSDLEKEPQMNLNIQNLMRVYMDILQEIYNNSIKNQLVNNSPVSRMNFDDNNTQSDSINSSTKKLVIDEMDEVDCACHRHKRSGLT